MTREEPGEREAADVHIRAKITEVRERYLLGQHRREVEANVRRAWELVGPSADRTNMPSKDRLARLARRAVEEQVQQELLASMNAPAWNECYRYVQWCVCYILGRYCLRTAQAADTPDSLWEPLRERIPQLYDLIEDVTQEAIVKIRDQLHTFRFESNFDTWRDVVVYRVLLDYYRREGNEIPSISLEVVLWHADEERDSGAEALDLPDPTRYGDPDEHLASRELVRIFNAVSYTHLTLPTILRV